MFIMIIMFLVVINTDNIISLLWHKITTQCIFTQERINLGNGKNVSYAHSFSIGSADAENIRRFTVPSTLPDFNFYL